MSDQQSATRQCPYCKEEIKAGAIRCKYCHAAIPPERPGHKGVCPFCKENINPQATRCLHCKANLAAEAQTSCQPGALKVLPRSRIGAPVLRLRRMLTSERCGGYSTSLVREVCDGCPNSHYGTLSDGSVVVWTFIGCTEDECLYEAQGVS